MAESSKMATALAQDARQRIAATPRDEMGFIEGGVSLTYKQIKWIVLRLDTELDSDADEQSGVEPTERYLWQKNAEFRAVYELCQENKREAFRLLGTQLLPKAFRAIDDLLSSESPRAKAQGLNFLLRTQGMMIDKQPRTDPNELAAVLVALRASNPPQFVQVPGLPALEGAYSLVGETAPCSATVSAIDFGTDSDGRDGGGGTEEKPGGEVLIEGETPFEDQTRSEVLREPGGLDYAQTALPGFTL